MWLLLSAALAQDYGYPTTPEHYGHWYPTAYRDHGSNTDYDCAEHGQQARTVSEQGIG